MWPIFVTQGKTVLDAARQVAAEAHYCMATGLHAVPPDEDQPSSPGYSLVTASYAQGPVCKLWGCKNSAHSIS